MADDWKVGDLALCVDDSPFLDRTIHVQKGTHYRVEAVGRTVIEGLPGLRLAAVPGVYRTERFRKIRPDEHEACEQEFVTLLKRSKVRA